MLKKSWTYLIIGIVAVGGIFLLEYNKPKQLNWFPSYVSHHKIPYGTYVLSDLMEGFFPNRITQIHKPPFELLSRNDTVAGTYFFVNSSVSFEEAELNTLLNWISEGNKAIIASESFESKLLDTLHLEQTSIYNDDQLQPTFYHQLANPQLQSEAIPFEKDYYEMAFDKIDTLKTLVLAEVQTKSDSTEIVKKYVNVIKMPFGDGEIILSSFPKAFTNYFILKDKNRNYTAGLLSYLDDDGQILMDNFHKSGKSFYTSPMYLFLNTKELKWAYYLALIGALIYVIFEGKRKQRAIPIVPPLKNQTLAFTRTIANMYYEKKEQKQITEHKIDYFLEYIRTRLHLPTQKMDQAFLTALALRSNNSLEDVKSLFGLIATLQSKTQIMDAELENLNKKIEAFKAHVDGKQ